MTVFTLALGLLVKPAAVILAAAALALALRHRTAAARHAVWAGAVLATLALPLLTITLPPIRVAAPVTTIRPPSTIAASNGDRATPRRQAPAPVWYADEALADRLPDVLLSLWIAGALLLIVRRLGAEVRVRRIMRRARRSESGVLLSDEVPAPAVAGVFRSVVLFPATAVTWEKADFNAALEHELSHARRGDGFFNLCGDLAKAIYWCNPLVHFAARRMRTESEVACDDRVLLRGADPDRYAQLLLTLARHAQMHGALPGAATAMARPRELESRLLTVLDARVARAPLSRWMPLTLGGLALVVAIPTASLTLQAAPSREPDTLGDSVARPSSERLPLGRDPYRVSMAAAEAVRGPDSALVRVLIAALDHQPVGEADLVRERAAWALAQVRDGRLVEPLLEALESRDWRVQSYAAWTLAIAHDPRAVPRLIPLLRHSVWRLRAMAAAALRHSADPRAAAAMDAALGDPAWQVRSEAVEYFAALGGPTLPARIRPLLDDRHIAVRLAAERALSPQ